MKKKLAYIFPKQQMWWPKRCHFVTAAADTDEKAADTIAPLPWHYILEIAKIYHYFLGVSFLAELCGKILLIRLAKSNVIVVKFLNSKRKIHWWKRHIPLAAFIRNKTFCFSKHVLFCFSNVALFRWYKLWLACFCFNSN